MSGSRLLSRAGGSTIAECSCEYSTERVAAEPGTPGYPALRAKGTKIPTGFGSHEPVLSIEGFAVLRYVNTLEHTGSILTRGSEHFYGNIPYAMTVTVTMLIVAGDNEVTALLYNPKVLVCSGQSKYIDFV